MPPCAGRSTAAAIASRPMPRSASRWRRGTGSPAEFVPIAEETGLIEEIGDWVLRTACAEAANWPVHVRVAVNVSPVQFRSQTLSLKVAAALAETGLDPR